MDTNIKYMHICLEIAKIALENGNPPVGAILVNDDKIIGVGIESGKSTGDITNHAEILAVKDAISNGKESLINQSIMYSTHEPCIMCSYVIRHHKVPKIIYSLSVSYIGGQTSKFSVLNTEHVPKWGNKPEIITGICQQETELLNEQFLNLKS